jgi:hypothetical protein
LFSESCFGYPEDGGELLDVGRGGLRLAVEEGRDGYFAAAEFFGYGFEGEGFGGFGFEEGFRGEGKAVD